MASTVRWKLTYASQYLVLPLVAGIWLVPLSNTGFAGEDQQPYSANNFGGIGLLEMRSARFAADGALSVGIHHNKHVTGYFASWQATPWLETTLSYFDHQSDLLGVDRSLDVKIRLLREGDYRPALAIGIQDALGSGRYAAEYIVASKRYYDFDVTAGLSWGYLGSRGGLGNMFKLFGDDFKTRSIAASGDIRSGSYFAGDEMAFFAGVEYFPPIKDLSIKAEYSGVDTTKLEGFEQFERHSAFNIGLNYRPAPWADLAVGFDHGDRFTVRLTLKQNLRRLKLKRWFHKSDPAPIIERGKSVMPEDIMPEIASELSGNDRIFDRLRRMGATITGITQQADRTVFRLRPEKSADINPMLLLGAILAEYDKVTLIISGPKGAAQKFDAERSGAIGRKAREKFRQSPVYAREKVVRDQGAGYAEQSVRAAFDKLDQAGLSPLSVQAGEKTAKVRKQSGPYFPEAKNIGRTARILSREMPDSVEKFTVISENRGIELSRVSLLRRDLEKANSYRGSPEEIWANTVIQDPADGTNDAAGSPAPQATYHPAEHPKFDWGIKPELLSHFGGNADGRFRADLYAKLYGSVELARGLELSAEIKQYILGDIDQIPVDDRPDIPKVRSDIARYAAEGRTALERMEMAYTRQFAPDFYGRFRAGLLEGMYGGFAAELLYRPYEGNLAVGLDLNWVRQRDFDQLFSFRDYQTVTGHAALYHENTDYNISTKLSVGRYLAGDYGATIDVSRRFRNGVRIGVWATYSDMSSEDFGEGSFDKGIYLTMPLEIFWYQPSRQEMRFNFRSLGRNGGQRLDTGNSLYDIVSPGRRERLAEEWRELLE